MAYRCSLSNRERYVTPLPRVRRNGLHCVEAKDEEVAVAVTGIVSVEFLKRLLLICLHCGCRTIQQLPGFFESAELCCQGVVAEYQSSHHCKYGTVCHRHPPN